MRNKVILFILSTVLVFSLVACQFTSFIPTLVATEESPQESVQPTQTSTPGTQVITLADLVDQQEQFISIYKNVSPGVVAIKVYDDEGAELGLGSGWVYSDEGYIITNDHVVDGGSIYEVDFTSGFKAYGELIGVDTHADLAVIKVDVPADELNPLILGDSNYTQCRSGGCGNWQPLWFGQYHDNRYSLSTGKIPAFQFSNRTKWRLFFLK